MGRCGAGWRSSRAGFADGEPQGRLTALQLVQTSSAEQTRPPCETSLSLPSFTVVPPARRRRGAFIPIRSRRILIRIFTGRLCKSYRVFLLPRTPVRAPFHLPANALGIHMGGRAPRFFSCIINGLCASFTCLRARRNEFIRPWA